MLASILHAILEVVFTAILEMVCYVTGRIVVPVFTLGRVQCDNLSAGTHSRKAWRASLGYRRGRHLVLTSDGTVLVGFVVLAMVLATVVYLCVRNPS